MIALYFLLLHYFIREVEKQGGEKEKSIIQTNNHANLKRYSKSLVAAEREKKATPHHLSAPYQVYTKGGVMGGAEYLWLESLFILFIKSPTQQQAAQN